MGPTISKMSEVTQVHAGIYQAQFEPSWFKGPGACGGLVFAALARAFQEAQDVPKSALGGFETTRQAFQFLKVGVSSRAPALFLEAAQRVSSSLLEYF